MERESRDARLRRNISELLQELRVAQAGVQILFGFLLAITFTEPYLRASEFTHTVHLVTVGLTVVAVGLMTAPAAWHRVLFRQGQRERIMRTSNGLAIAGLACLAGAVSGTVLLIVDIIAGMTPAIVAAAVALVGLGTVWFALPMRHHRSEDIALDDEDDEDEGREETPADRRDRVAGGVAGS